MFYKIHFKEIRMKEYVTPSIELWHLGQQDVITESNPNDNNYEDNQEWGD